MERCILCTQARFSHAGSHIIFEMYRQRFLKILTSGYTVSITHRSGTAELAQSCGAQ